MGDLGPPSVSMDHHPPVLKLRCAVQNYDWGKIGAESEVARLHELNSGSDIDLGKPYAELWIGTHQSGPSYVVDSDGMLGLSLKSWIEKNPNAVGVRVLDKWGPDLPFLLKILSVEKALSIQAHPDKELAQILHKLQPSLYKDDNHKPEMTLAITEFEALCGFATHQELKGLLCSVPELVELIGSGHVEQFVQMSKDQGEEENQAALSFIFGQLMNSSIDDTRRVILMLKRRLLVEKEIRKLTDKEELMLRLESQYPGDMGVMAAFFLNYMKLKPGEALYLGANEPHAYICGEVVECMSNSDNVVRAGLTPKHRDIKTLLSMLTYKQGTPAILHGIPLNQYTKRFIPPFEEFELDHCILPDTASVSFPSIPGPSIFLLKSGRGTLHTDSHKEHIKEGQVLFVPANTEIIFTALSEELQLYRAGVNSTFFHPCNTFKLQKLLPRP